jgi:hypothetical protein
MQQTLSSGERTTIPPDTSRHLVYWCTKWCSRAIRRCVLSRLERWTYSALR